jgi:Holliday junction DNA helicase RuvA
MYNHIKGRLVEKNPAYVVVEAGGIGYHVNISLNTYEGLGADENTLLYTHLVVREDAWQLFGFITQRERQVFQLLISVSGVGPNTARVILSSLTATEVESAILMENVGLLQAVKGIGAKTAQRIVLDLRDKIGKGLPAFSSGTATLKAPASGRAEAVTALEILGFSRLQIEKVVNAIVAQNADMPVELIVKEALKKL